jgi:hypothetical protein
MLDRGAWHIASTCVALLRDLRMRRETFANTMLLCITLLVTSAAACSSGGGAGTARDPTPLAVSDAPKPAPEGSSEPLPSPRATAAPPTAAPPPPKPSPAGTAAPAATTASPAASAPPKPKTAAECKALTSKVTTPVLNQTDTQLQMRDLFQAYHETFRCCFDALYAPQNPGVGGKVVLLVHIDANGTFESTEIVAAETTVPSTEVQQCMVDIAKSLPYPKPLSGKDITYRRNFDFKPRR